MCYLIDNQELTLGEALSYMIKTYGMNATTAWDYVENIPNMITEKN